MSYNNASKIDQFLRQNAEGFTQSQLYLDFPEIIARKSAALTVGNNLIINSDDQQIENVLNRWMEQNNIQNKLIMSCYNASKWGKTILYLVPAKDGKNVILTYVKNIFAARVSTVNDEEQCADIWGQDYSGDNPIFTHVEFTPSTITCEYWTGPKNTQINAVEAPIANGLTLIGKKSSNNPFFMVPVAEIINMPFNNIFNQSLYNLNPDWLPAMNLIKSYNQLFEILIKEGLANRTRIFAEMQPKDLEKIKKKALAEGGINDVVGDIWINSPFSANYSNNTTGTSINVVEGDPKLQVYTDALTDLESKIFNASGYDANHNPGQAGNNYENKTASIYGNKHDKETTDFKQRLFRPKWYKLFDCVLMFYGINPFDDDGKRKYSFTISNLSINDSSQIREDTQADLAMGIISQAEARARILNESMSEAKKEIEDVRDDLEAVNMRFGNDNDKLQDNGEQQGDTLGGNSK